MKFDILTMTVSAYGLAVFFYIALFLMVITSWHEKRLSRRLLIALVVNAAWAGFYIYDAVVQDFSLSELYVLEYIRDTSWVIFLLGLLNTGPVKPLPGNTVRIIYLLILVINFYGMSHAVLEFQNVSLGRMDLSVIGKFVFVFMGLVLVEQLYRNSRDENKRSIKPLCLALGSLFVFDLFLFSNVVLFGYIDQDIWVARGLVFALVVPLLAVSIKRSSSFSTELFVSRHVVFYTATFVGAGVYLIVMAVIGYYIRYYGGSWGVVAQIVFLFGAVLILFFIVSSETARSRVMVFLGKHFYKNKYDYREEWMRFIKNLSNIELGDDIRVRVIQSIADIVGSTGGLLWLKQENQGFFCQTCWDMDDVQAIEANDGELAMFLSQSDWLIDLDEYKNDSSQYSDLKIPQWLQETNNAWLVIPLRHQQELIGFLVLARPRISREINWEDRDLLKTAGRQASSYLALLSVTEKIDELHRFEAFNRLSAYVVHDLKNLVAQLELVVTNAAKHRDNPAFMDDAIKTVENAVGKMTRLLNQLRKGRFEQQSSDEVSLNEALAEVVMQRSKDNPQPQLKTTDKSLVVLAEKNRLTLVIEHIVQNAQEATDNKGSVTVSLEEADRMAIISIKDTGVGMDTDFIRNRLFKPFETTKGNAGMGIGVYESREFIANSGGRMEVESVPGVGTEFRIFLPLHKTH